MSQPNILYIHSHDTGRYVQPYGYAVPTPNMQRLAEQGVVFRQCFCCNPTCSASRASLLTGQYPHQNGMTGLAHRGFSLNDYGKHLVNTLKAAGYHTALSGIQHIAEDARTIGYDELLTLTLGVDVAHGRAVEFLGRSHDKPFFLSVGFFETHREFPEPGPQEDARWCRPAGPLPDCPETRQDMAAFQTSARVLDEKVGQVLTALDANGLADNTLVICTTDHGIAMPHMKCTLRDDGIGVMLMMRGPGGFEGGRVCDELISQVDIFPTICDLAGIAAPPWLEGESILPCVRGQGQAVRDTVFAEVNYHVCYEPQRCIRTKRYKYIRRYEERQRPVLPNCDDSPAKTTWMAHGWRDANWHAREQLYDCVLDPNEANNLVGNPDFAEVLAEMRAKLEAWQQQTDDPILSGSVPAPVGARLNDPNDVSAANNLLWVLTEETEAQTVRERLRLT